MLSRDDVRHVAMLARLGLEPGEEDFYVEQLGAFLRVTEDLARAQAGAADRRLAEGDGAGPLTGIPVAIKDVLSVRDVETTAGSRILRGYRPPYDATAVARLREAGAVFLGM